jgi:hypothetical protein
MFLYSFDLVLFKIPSLVETPIDVSYSRIYSLLLKSSTEYHGCGIITSSRKHTQLFGNWIRSFNSNLKIELFVRSFVLNRLSK